ncbi:hypothetical protein KsCSTR_42000 [Candidatus Kuenenia stuttgartiensis]|uniref:4Fe-4S ferredoxin-type domain-containing protein n=1 Tax=Kuenenia stuttgartiensis TaxID=174633 RepID=A0A2C9CHP4_KUEST|nr:MULTISPECIES: 4Fe-4S binding protein [Kuenenia]MBE7547946.1 4Fe-4S binding protein [Planctomycetia bacterium]MBW7941183.1 4Fe-4S binding protein [Candidatus Kuenenia stuttgartiensis]MBZ0192929.1 4Fe-4S binding protein [Candidatus Kuenenia stuttgartiensis]MCF6151879.1 4Fe-4S dicluster domain-containing protein [Candidatus Kuenenia stuttgartiensis]MCL4727241.1 4Fe-4S binding protein [Candidatus Kuenenia stuttgartiensis]
MEWDESATLLLEKVPPFVHKKVRDRVESLAREQGKNLITSVEVIAAREAFAFNQNLPPQTVNKETETGKLSVLRKYQKYFDAQGNPVLYQAKACRGAEVNCPFLIKDSEILADKLREKLKELHFTDRLIEKIEGRILPHHTMKLAVAGCPNSCSMPQIKDFGVHAVEPVFVDAECECIECMKCVEACREDAITVKDAQVTIDKEKCVECGICAKVCPVGTIKASEVKFRVMIGGKLGRHPRFALELFPNTDESTVLKALEVCAEMIISNKEEHRFRVLVEQKGIEEIKNKI